MTNLLTQQSYNRKQKRELKNESDRPLVDFIKSQEHYLPDLKKWLNNINDPRHKSYITYDLSVLLYTVILKNICSIESMRNMTEQFNEDSCIETLSKLFDEDLDEIPHYVTINDFLERLQPEELYKVRGNIVKELIKKRSFEHCRFLDKYWKVIIDATGLYSFKERHCEHCLTKKHRNKETNEVEYTEYYHNVLEAKIIFGDNTVISLDTEFIENESERVTKQDCEINAFKRMSKRIKSDYPRLPICILADSLYANDPVFQICKKNNWEYIIRFKEGSIPSLAEEFNTIKNLTSNICNTFNKGKECTSWVNGIDYKGNETNVIEYINVGDNDAVHTFTWISSANITKRHASEIVKTGRDRWMIENQGFNTQKNHRYYLQHLNSKDTNAMKNHYLLTQIADTLLQLYTASAKILKMIKKTLKKISSDILEAFRRDPITAEDILFIAQRTAVHSG